MKDTVQSYGEQNDKKPADENETSQDADDRWLIRECSVYKHEYKECTSLRGRFQQYFVYGHTLDCHQWKKDHNDCCKFHDHGDSIAGMRLMASERARRRQRLDAHYGNTTWQRRTQPPVDWASPLPEWLVKRDENTYLAIKARELSGEAVPVPDPHKLCAIM